MNFITIVRMAKPAFFRYYENCVLKNSCGTILVVKAFLLDIIEGSWG